jgi:cyclophilin family peptidyl-prolyl cis-trans isomerase
MPKTSISLIIIASIFFAAGLGYSLYSRVSSPADPKDILEAQKVARGSSEQEVPQIPKVESEESNSNLKVNNNKDMSNTKATLHTNKGDITIEFYDSMVPNTVANFVKLAKSGFYDGVKFHRVIKGFMIQGGDPLSKGDTMKSRWGTGGPGYQFEDEITPENRNDVGTIAMANAGPDTNGSQFFINVKANNFLDPKHTVFGKVTAGMDVVTSIENTPVDGSDKPVDAVIIKNISF